MCGLVMSTEASDPAGDGEVQNCGYDGELAARVWTEMEAHVRREHCAPCSGCGAEAAGVVELVSGEMATWLRRSRTRSPLHALRAHRREQARNAERVRRSASGEVDMAAGLPWPPADHFYRYGLGAIGPNAVGQPQQQQQQRRRRRCGHAVCLGCAHALAKAKSIECPAEGCRAALDSRVLALFLMSESARQQEQLCFECVACGESRPERDKVSLHDPDRHPFRGLRDGLAEAFERPWLPLSLLPPESPAPPRPRRGRASLDDDGSDVDEPRKRRRSDSCGALASACELCAPCAKRWLAIQSKDGVAYVRCPTPKCRAPLSRDTLELLLTPEAYRAHLKRARQSFESRLSDLRQSAKSMSFATAKSVTQHAADSLAPRSESHKTDDDGTLAFLRWAGDATRACPECHVIIYRSEGCAHMSCACGAEFNWDRAERIVHFPESPTQSHEEYSIASPPKRDEHIPDNHTELRRALVVERARVAALQHELDRLRRRGIADAPTVRLLSAPTPDRPTASPVQTQTQTELSTD